jgi:hypothetical protein
MGKLLLILGISLGMGSTACSGTGRAVRGSTTAHVVNAQQVASSPPPSYSALPFVIESTQPGAPAPALARWYWLAPQYPLMSSGTGREPAMLPQ